MERSAAISHNDQPICDQWSDPFYEVEKELTPEGLFTLALWFQNCDETDKAIDCYRMAINRNPRFVEALYNLGFLYYHRNDWSDAIPCFREAASLRPDFTNAVFALAASLEVNNQPDEALLAYQDTLRCDSRHTAAHLNLSILLSKSHRLPEAIYHVHRALELSPDFPQAQDLLFRLAQHACDWTLTSPRRQTTRYADRKPIAQWNQNQRNAHDQHPPECRSENQCPDRPQLESGYRPTAEQVKR